MSTRSVNAPIVDLPGDGGYSDCSIFSGRGSTKRDAISVEDYDRDRHLNLWTRSSHKAIKFESPIHIDLDQYNDDLRILRVPPIPKFFEKGQSSSSSRIKRESPIYVDLDQYNYEDDDCRILSFSPISKSQEKGQSSSFSRTFECEICAESKPIIESFRISGCSHSYCNDCVSKYIAAKLQDNILSVACPVSGCSGRLELDQCREILPGEVFNRWGDALCEAVVMRSKRFYCPYKDCSALVFLDESEEKMRESECPHCHRMVCVECGTKWHPEITCQEFQKLGVNERESEDILLKNMAESYKWRRCPSCKFYIEKSQGCLYMKCRCGLAFCYNCGTPSRDHSHYCHSCKR